ncbi:MAG: 30S ribosomal protein S6 [Desulfobulbus propionicus]|nr:MAG: 30S ribosomal protein S6 [Desulfobulbus propionicus]
MRHYETIYILRPNLGEAQFNEIIERTNALITNEGGEILSLERWGLKKLAYEIKKEGQGYYVYVNYTAPGTIIKELERIFRIDDRLLRFLTVKLNDNMDEAAVVLEKEKLAQEAAAKAAEQESSEEITDNETGNQGEESSTKE